jgi:non-ribosomal peptide synthetase component E (peptide arylation enzyme)
MRGYRAARAYLVAHQTKTSAEGVQRSVSRIVARYKRARGGVFFIDQIPKTACGKILPKDLSNCQKELDKGYRGFVYRQSILYLQRSNLSDP